ncbi:regulatory protein RecX [uncultured Robinsoniella sp.]|uniref:regulatory protein RecX n=1 Tax=uncultured Robinsoniella sp. TaxID=904190 RepID=UPI00374E87FB
MIITNIEAVTKAKSRVYIDEQLAFVLYKGELSRYKIKKDKEISDETYREIIEEVLTKRAKVRCIYLLKSMDRTEYQLRTKLKQGGYPDEAIDGAIDYVKNLHYIDDNRYAQYYIDGRTGSKSKQQITQDLLRRGISKELIQSIYEQKEPEDETEQIRKWVEKKRVDLETADSKEINRLYGFLMRKGFQASDISRVIRGREYD